MVSVGALFFTVFYGWFAVIVGAAIGGFVGFVCWLVLPKDLQPAELDRRRLAAIASRAHRLHEQGVCPSRQSVTPQQSALSMRP